MTQQPPYQPVCQNEKFDIRFFFFRYAYKLCISLEPVFVIWPSENNSFIHLQLMIIIKQIPTNHQIEYNDSSNPVLEITIQLRFPNSVLEK